MRESRQAHPYAVHETFAEIVERFQRRLYIFVRNLIRQDEAAHDLVQDVFCDAWRSANAGQPPFTDDATEEELRRWLFRVAYNKAFMSLRRNKLIHWESLEGMDIPVAPVDATTPTFDDLLAEGEALQAALAELSPQDVACLLLRVVYGFSSTEVGTIVGASTEAVMKRLSRAKQRLRVAYLRQNAQSEERPCR
jgi:RNA polymerase sigma-70 factor, ECF subfamily